MPDASAITRIAQMLGGAFGTALIAVILTAATTKTHPEDGFDAAFSWITATTIAAAVIALLLPAQEQSKAHVTDMPDAHGSSVAHERKRHGQDHNAADGPRPQVGTRIVVTLTRRRDREPGKGEECTPTAPGHQQRRQRRRPSHRPTR